MLFSFFPHAKTPIKNSENSSKAAWGKLLALTQTAYISFSSVKNCITHKTESLMKTCQGTDPTK